MSRSIELLVEEQARRWQLRRREAGEGPRRGIVALANTPGAPGREVARGVSRELEYDLFDDEIVQQVARSARLSERVVSALDEHDRSWLGDWLGSFTAEAWLSTYGYLQELSKVVGAIARHGGAVVVGHGAHALLGPDRALRVLVTAPLERRVAAWAEATGASREEARTRVLAEEAERSGFLERHFHVGLSDPAAYDVVVNTETLSVRAAVETVVAAAIARRSEAARRERVL